MNIQINAGTEHRLNLLTSLRTNLAQVRAALTDNDVLLRLTLHIQVHVHIQQRVIRRAALAELHLLNRHSNRVGQLLTRTLQGSLTHQLRDEGCLRLIGQLTLRVQRRRQRSVLRQQVSNRIHLEMLHSRHRDNRSPAALTVNRHRLSNLTGTALSRRTRTFRERHSIILAVLTLGALTLLLRTMRGTLSTSRTLSAHDLLAERLNSQQLLTQLLRAHSVSLRHNSNHRLIARRHQLRRNVTVTRTNLLIRRNAEAQHIHLREGACHQVVQTLTQQSAGAVNTRGVHQNQLVLVLVHNTADRVAGRLRTVRGDSHLLTDHSVRQSRLTRIRAAHQRREARTEVRRVGRQRGAQVQSAQIERGVLLVHCVSPCQTPCGVYGVPASSACAFRGGAADSKCVWDDAASMFDI